MFRENNIATVISLVISLTIVGMHVQNRIGQYDPINLLKEAGWQISIVLLSFIFLISFVIIASPKTAEKVTSGAWGGMIIVVAITLVGLIIATSTNVLPRESVFSYIFDSELWSFIVAIGVFWIIIWWVNSE